MDIREREVISLRILPGWFGTYRIQIRRRLVHVRLVSRTERAEEEAGTGPWRRMRAADFPEVMKFL